jgi:hypothetical protein
VSYRSALPRIRGCGLLGDRLRAEGWLDDAAEAYATLEELVPDDARATLRSALAHAGAGRLDIAERLLTRVARSGGRSGDAEIGELARQLGRVLAESALAGGPLKAGAEEGARLRRLLLELSQAETGSIVLVRAEAAAPELVVRLQTSETDALRASAADEATRHATRELLLPSDGKQLALSP